MPRRCSARGSRRWGCSARDARVLEAMMGARMGWSPGPAIWKDDLAPIHAADWNYDRAAHLLAHAGFGGTPAEIEKLTEAGLERAVGSLVHYESIPNPK